MVRIKCVKGMLNLINILLSRIIYLCLGADAQDAAFEEKQKRNHTNPHETDPYFVLFSVN